MPRPATTPHQPLRARHCEVGADVSREPHRRAILPGGRRAVLALTLAGGGLLGALGLPAAAMAAAAPAAAATSDACQAVHIGPSLAPGTPVTSYFNLSVASGSSSTDTLLVANPSSIPCGVTLLPAYGKAAVNAGDAYVAIEGVEPCVGASCWLRGLPQTVTVAPNQRTLVTFRVSVPGGTGSGQYLA